MHGVSQVWCFNSITTSLHVEQIKMLGNKSDPYMLSYINVLEISSLADVFEWWFRLIRIGFVYYIYGGTLDIE